jgi:hypothetical protein
LEIRHQHIFDLFGMRRCFSQPFHVSVFFEPFGAGQTTGPTAFCQQYQSFQNLMLWRPFAKEDRSTGGRECFQTGFALKPLYTAACKAYLFKVRT